ncbi:MAG: flagellar basal-body MS-ring/collar protein FliF [Pseudomonadota bacterium]|nr:flagellar basal-body MS-ring/collar protein FliF [Pseudomonadota bacterium]
MQGLVSVWRILTPAKRVMLIGAVAATIAMFTILARTASSSPMTMLYSGLDGRAAGQVIAALERMNVEYEVRGEAIYVPAAKRDSTRMSLAGEGLPQMGQAGYELLESLNGFSTTSDMFDATYWRAKEGELARTILATPGVRAARVHIANQQTSAFSRSAPAPTAAVTVSMGQGRLSGPQAQAIRFLVASAVPGLAAEQVAVIDSAAGVILSPGDPEGAVSVDSDAEAREQKLEKDILNLLEARVGAGNARVQVALDLDMEREAVSERIFNPDGRVISGKETTEVTESTTGASSTVSVSSNLPEGDASGGQGSRTQRTETRETIKYDMSEMKREREKMPGSVRRMSVAVFVNQVAEAATEEGAEPVLRSDAEIATLRDLVAMAAGYDEKRGDTLTIQTLPFRPLAEGGTVAKPDLVGDFMANHLMNAIQILVLSMVTLVLGLFVVKPLLSTKDAPQGALEGGTADGTPTLTAANAPQNQNPAEPPDAIAALKQIASSKTDETATLIKSWLENAENAA